MNEHLVEDRDLLRLLLVAQDIKKDPSCLHAGFKHKDAPQTPDFDWNVFVARIDTMMEEDRIKNCPLRQSKLALNALNADLTYDNRNKAKELIKKVVEALRIKEKKSYNEREQSRKEMKEEQEMFLVSHYLTDEFWQDIVSDKPTELKYDMKLPRSTTPLRDEVLLEEKRRYETLAESMRPVLR